MRRWPVLADLLGRIEGMDLGTVTVARRDDLTITQWEAGEMRCVHCVRQILDVRKSRMVEQAQPPVRGRAHSMGRLQSVNGIANG